MDSLSFDDILNGDKPSEPSSDLSFDDIVGQQPKEPKQEAVPVSAREPRDPPKRAPISAREPADADTSNAWDDIRAGVKTLQQVRPGLAVAGAAGDIARAKRTERVSSQDEAELSQIDQRLAEIEMLPDDQWKQAGDERAKLTARRAQLQMMHPLDGGIEKDRADAKALEAGGVKSIVKNLDEINDLNKQIEAIPLNPAAKKFNSPEGDTFGQKVGSMWDALASDPYGVVRTTVLRSLPASSPTIIASIVGGLAGPEGAAGLAALTGGSVEMGTSMAQYLSQDLQERGIDPTNKEAVEKYALEHTDEILTLIGKSRARAVVIGTVDAVTGGLTEKLAEGVVTAPFVKKAATSAAGAGIDATGGAVGEAGAEIAAGDELDPAQIGGEFVGGLGQGSITTAGQIARESVFGPRSAKPEVEPINEKGANAAETAALNATQQTVSPPRPSGQPPVAPTQAPASTTGAASINVGETSPDVTEAVTAASNPSAPQPPKPPGPNAGPGAAGEYIKQLALFREMERKQREASAAAQPGPPPAEPAAGPQVGGAPAAPPPPAVNAAPPAAPVQSPAAQAIQGMDAAREDKAPGAISAPAPTPTESSPAKQAADALPPVKEITPAQTTAPSETGGSAPAPVTPEVTEAPTETPAAPKERKYRTVTRRDVLLDAGIPAEQYDSMKPKAVSRMASDLRAKVQRETGEKLEFMDPAEREKALTKAWAEIQQAREKAAAKNTPKLPPKTQAAVETSKAKEAPAEDAAAQKEAERKARVEAYMAEQRQKAQEEAAKPAEPGKPRILRPTTDEALRKDAESAVAMRDKQAENEAQIKESEARQEAKQDQIALGEDDNAPAVSRASKEGKAEIARRENNKGLAENIVAADEHNTNKVEDSFQNTTAKGELARNAVVARARRMVEAAQKLMTPGSDGRVLPQRLKMSKDPVLAPNTAQMILFEAERLARKDKPTLKDVTDFRTNEVLLRAGMVDEYLNSRAVEGDIQSSPQATQTNKDGEVTDVVDRTASDAMTPEENLAAREEGDDETQARANEAVADQAPASKESPKVTREVKEGVDYTAGKAKPPKVVEKVKKRTINRPVRFTRMEDGKPRGDSGNIGLKRQVQSIVSKTTMSKVMDRLDPGSMKLFGDKLTQKIVGMILGRIREAVPDLPVVIIPQSEMEAITGNKNVGGFYDPNPGRFGPDGHIVISDKYAPNGRVRVHLIAHEGLHALFAKALETSTKLSDSVTDLADSVREYVTNAHGADEADRHYGLTIDPKTGRVDPHEFMSEALTEPEFQQMLREIPVSEDYIKKSGLALPEGVKNGATVWDSLKGLIRKFLLDAHNLLFGNGTPEDTVLDAVMTAGEHLDYYGSELRKLDNKGYNPPGAPSEVRYAKVKDPNVGELLKRGLDPKSARSAAKIIKETFKDGISDEDLDLIAQAFRTPKEQKAKSAWTQLRDGGVPYAKAREINDFLKAEVGKSVDPETVPLLIADAIEAFGQKDTSESNGTVPPYKEPPSPGMGPAAPKKPEAPAFKGKDEGLSARLRRMALKTMTLDFMRQKFSKLFADKNGNALEDFVKAVQSRDNIVDEFAKPLEEAGVEFEALARTKPEEAMEVAELAMEATRLNVKLGQNEDNSHLGTTAAKGLQGKKALAKLNARFDKLSPETQALYKKLTTLYRDAHNTNVEALAYNILSQLEPKLSNSDLMALLKKVTEGRLTEDDAKLIDNKTVFHALERASELKVLKGDYFPMMRYGEHVVTTTEKLDDPKWASIPMKVGKGASAPVKTEVEGNILRVQVDPTIRGAQTAVKRQLMEYAAEHELTLQGISTMYRDKKTGKLVSKGEQLVDREYDTVYEARFQTEGVHFFESEKEAREFQKQSDSHVTSQVMKRRDFSAEDMISGSQLAAIVNHINAGNDKVKNDNQRKALSGLVENAVIAQMSGNRAQKRYLARRNVIGASQDLARGAFSYARAAGNYHATLRTAPAMREAMQRMAEIEKNSKHTNNAAAITDVMNEMRAREANIQNPNRPMTWTRDVATLSYFDKLFSPAYSLINAMQPMTTTWPVLAGRYGMAQAGAAISAAYYKVGLEDTVGSGVANTYRATRDVTKTMIDTSDLMGSLRKNLGKEYTALLDELESRGLLNTDTGLEIGSVIEQGRGKWGRALHKVDRIGRQLPNGIEVLNRAVTAVATYDLAIKAKKTKQEAIQEAYSTTSNTQGDYRGSNSPNWMKAPGLGWMLQFKKYALLQYQLMSDMAVRSFKDSSKAERIIARKQLMNLVATQAALAGTFGLPGLELIKLGFMAASFVIPGMGGWDDEEEKLRKLVEEKTGKTVGSIINNGLLSTVTGLDFASRLSLADMITGLPPRSYDGPGMMEYAGRFFAGAPGGMVVDWMTGTKELLGANSADAREKAIGKLIPMKTIADTVGAVRNYQNGEVGLAGAAANAFGFRTLKQAETGRERGALKRQAEQKKADEKSLTNDLRAALDRNDKAAQLKAIAAIREYNQQLRRSNPKARPINPAQIRKYWVKDKRKAAQ